VVAAAVILDPNNIPAGLNDSKKLSPKRREELFAELTTSARVAVAIAPPRLIETLNIRGATLWAMRSAVLALSALPDIVLIDGRDLPDGLPCPGRAVIGGDGLSASIAAASIVAKVTRDMMCPVMDSDTPGFGFGRHKGYGTAAHLSALAELGPGVHHRRLFGPVAARLLSR
jgi:ribonuclease HII